jgi:hypothetical protein
VNSMPKTSSMSSRERILAALSCRKPDYVPCVVHAPVPHQRRFGSTSERWDWQLEQGIDVISHMPSLPIRFAPEVSIREWKDRPPNASYPVLHREYRTPAGTLTAVAYQTPDWRYGERVPLYDDLLTSRSVKFLITQPSDLAAFEYLLPPPMDEDIAAYREMAAQYRKYARDRDLLFAAGWGSLNGRSGLPDSSLVGCDGGIMGGDALLWLCGQDAMLWTYDQPEFLQEFLHLIGVWNRRQMEVILDTGVDMIYKRGWYENAPFYSPSLFRKFMVPELCEEAILAHQAGAKLAYVSTSGLAPFLDAIVEAGVDLVGPVDPAYSAWNDLEVLAQLAAGRIALSGGVGNHLPLEASSVAEVRQAVARAIGTFGPHGGYILSAMLASVIRLGDPAYSRDEEQEELMRRYYHALIEAWRELRYV